MLIFMSYLQLMYIFIAFYQTFIYIRSLPWNYISDNIVSYICFKNIVELLIQSNNLPQIIQNV